MGSSGLKIWTAVGVVAALRAGTASCADHGERGCGEGRWHGEMDEAGERGERGERGEDGERGG